MDKDFNLHPKEYRLKLNMLGLPVELDFSLKHIHIHIWRFCRFETKSRIQNMVSWLISRVDRDLNFVMDLYKPVELDFGWALHLNGQHKLECQKLSLITKTPYKY